MNDSSSLFSEGQEKSKKFDSRSHKQRNSLIDELIRNISTQELETVRASLLESRQKQEKAKQEYHLLEQSFNDLKQRHSLVVARHSLLSNSHQELKEKLQAKEQRIQKLKESIQLEEELFLAELSNLQQEKTQAQMNEYLKVKVLILLREKETMKSKIESLQSEMTSLESIVVKFKQPQKCKHCAKYFSLLQNSKKSCLFHPGKLKFYSCKGCGGDQYLSCCNYCKSCKEGCREGEHVFS